MKCMHCHQREATVHVEESRNGRTRKMDLCQTCAKELGWSLASEFPTMGANPLENAWFKTPLQLLVAAQNGFAAPGFALGVDASAYPEETGMVCPRCGTRFEQFRATGLLGCPDCYRQFAPGLQGLIRRVQAGWQHVGRKVGKPFQANIHVTIQPPEKAGEAKAAADTTRRTAKTAQTLGGGTSDSESSKAESRSALMKLSISELEARQKEAVKQERYEQAALIRDLLREKRGTSAESGRGGAGEV